MRVGFSADGARRALNEIITGLWSFTDAQGLLTDDVNERTGGAGVTVDGLLIRDAGIPEAAVTAHEAALAILESQIVNGTLLARLGSAETITGEWIHAGILRARSTLIMDDYTLATDRIIGASVAGDSNDRFFVNAAGTLLWGTGAAPGDTNLFRNAAGELATADNFRVGGILDLAGDIELSSSDVTLTTGAKNNQATGTATVLRILLSTGVVNITGFAGGRTGRMLAIMNLGGSALTLNDEDAGSTAANRMLFTGGADHVLAERDIALLWYDTATSRWKLLASTV